MNSKINDICLICGKEKYSGFQSLGDLEYMTSGEYSFNFCKSCSFTWISPLLDQKGLETISH